MIWIQSMLVILLTVTLNICYSSGGSIKIIEPKVIGKAIGNKCKKTTSGVTSCVVKVGDKAVLTGSINIVDADYLGIESLVCSLTLTGEKDIITMAPTCQRTGGNIVIKGECAVTSMPGGTYPMDPFSFTVPKPKSQGCKVLKMVCDAVWSDQSKTKNMEVGAVTLVYQ